MEQDLGVFVKVSDAARFRRILYQARAHSLNPALQDLILFVPAGNDCVLVAKKSVELEA